MDAKYNEWMRGQLLEALEESGISRSELARRAGYGRHRITELLNGRIQLLAVDEVDSLLRLMGRRIDLVVRDNDDPVATTDQSQAQRALLRTVLNTLPRLSDDEAGMLDELVRRFAPKDADDAA